MGAAPSHPAPAQQRRSPTAAPPHYHPPAPYVHPPYAPAPYPYGYTYPPPPHGSGVAPSPWAGQPHPNPWYGGYPGHAPPPYQMPMMPMNGPPPAIVAEPQQAVTIRNEVNVKRSSLHLQRDPTDPKKLLVAFTFDATVAGSLSIFLAAREGDDCSFTELFPHVHKARVFTFKKGLGQQFVEPAGSGWDVSAFPEEQLFNFSPADSVFPLVIRTRVEPKSVPDKSSGPLGSAATSSTSHAGQSSAGAEPSGSSDLVGGPLPRSAQSQMTYAVFERVAPGKITEKTASLDLGRAVPSNDGPFGESSEHPQPRFALRAFKQKIWVDGTKYEVQEIYGIEQCGRAGPSSAAKKGRQGAGDGSSSETTSDGNVGADEEDDDEVDGKDCVICLSAPRDTTVLPCRHMCMCADCAKVLRYQTNKCPICRQPVERLLEIRVPPARAPSLDEARASPPHNSTDVQSGGTNESREGPGADLSSVESQLDSFILGGSRRNVAASSNNIREVK
eukprot:TRINITY_DN12013_c0_g1_i1.p1 TRINITY_DN12013_c0_g1~~TRINITY_DN12013_c0_g1_i1.p1  ORF type:complete len:502 (+),score=25.50 TRINITY_DN12013_c0_g1_i1:121-1626(+)